MRSTQKVLPNKCTPDAPKPVKYQEGEIKNMPKGHLNEIYLQNQVWTWKVKLTAIERRFHDLTSNAHLVIILHYKRDSRLHIRDSITPEWTYI